MEWQTALTIIVSIITAHVVVLGLVAGLFNKRIEDLREDTNRRFDRVEEEIRDLKQEIREIRQLLYRFF
ncbi:MAG: hypothetical protein ACK42C_00925 [Aquificaceae bacterium]|uniref:hypothetical protein n=1 Tax=Hydrogenobacter sp. Uz 6-8 TaxID=3384828 RepID=UPI000F0F0FCA|nr:MAG: hypothetical protein D6804_00675 [Aquificota bacterium]